MTIATGLSLTPLLRAEKKEFRTNIVKRAFRRNFALQKLSHLHSPEMVKYYYTDKRLRIIYTPTLKEHWNY
jgi:hypothetical protein